MALQTYDGNATDIAADLANNTTGAITPALLRGIATGLLDGIWGFVTTAIDNADSPYSVDLDVTQVLITDSTSAGVTVNLPAVASSAGKYLFVLHTGSANTTVLDGASTENINGAETLTLTTQYDWALIVCGATEWHAFRN